MNIFLIQVEYCHSLKIKEIFFSLFIAFLKSWCSKEARPKGLSNPVHSNFPVLVLFWGALLVRKQLCCRVKEGFSLALKKTQKNQLSASLCYFLHPKHLSIYREIIRNFGLSTHFLTLPDITSQVHLCTFFFLFLTGHEEGGLASWESYPK